ncbi:MAG: hypothetical protein VX610_04595 [SAR324 cluster bacterium]|nr:hypothetical protein [SAR324 cluster bacterium]
MKFMSLLPNLMTSRVSVIVVFLLISLGCTTPPAPVPSSAEASSTRVEAHQTHSGVDEHGNKLLGIANPGFEQSGG